MNDISISTIINNRLKSNEDFIINTKKNKREKKLHKWIDDKNVKTCYSCSNHFTFSNRKHHCRACGNIFCHKCSNYFITIPKDIVNIPVNNLYFKYFDTNKDRVCLSCYNYITEQVQLKKILKMFFLLPLDIKDYTTLSKVCKTWNRVSKHYYNLYKGLLFKFPNYKYTINDINILNLNKHYFCGHSKWVLRLILTNNWKNSNSSKIILDIAHNDICNTTCKSIKCNRNCLPYLTLEDIVIALSKKFTYLPLIKFLLKSMKIYVINYNGFRELSCYLQVIVNLLHYYKNFTQINILMQNLLLFFATKNRNISNSLFWLLTQYVENPNSAFYFSNFRSKLVDCLDKEIYSLFQTGYDFTQNLLKITDLNHGEAVINLKRFLKEYSTDRYLFSLPVNFCKNFEYIDYSQIRCIDSKTRPIILPCVYESSKVYNIMLKKEDIRIEAIIMNIIKLIDYFLKTEENLDLYITTYNILPISTKYGYIEFVPDSKTLYYIKEELKFSIQNWVIENNPDIDIHTIRENICRSCAAYCIITYVLGIGDRHLDNIMITKEGKLFHIDFGYILGRDPKIMSPEIRLTPEMIDAMGGIHSKYYLKFKKYSNIAFNCVRRHSNVFYILLLDIMNLYPKPTNITKEYIRNYIFSRFIPGGSEENALEQIQNKIDFHSSRNSYAESIIDYFHKKNKSSKSNSSPQKTEYIKKAYNYSVSTKKYIFNSVTKFFK